MKKKIKTAFIVQLAAELLALGLCKGLLPEPHIVYGKEEKGQLSSHCYEFDGDSHYEISDENGTEIEASPYGMLCFDGDISKITYINEVPFYEVASGNLTLSYMGNDIPADVPSDQWHIVEDKSKTIDGIKLDENIKTGALILQTSLTGDDWITEAIYTDIFDGAAEAVQNFYTTREIQQINGCYYRVIVAYRVGRQIEDKKYWFVSVDHFEYKKYAEVYEFYLINSSENSADTVSPSTLPRKELGYKINTGKDNGFSGETEITREDPHYGWDIGTFFVNGYTRETTDGEEPIYLKNVGDRVTLWFTLAQDITCLNGNSKLSINEDTNGYDQYFEIDRTNFKRGALIIRYTDFEGVRHEPVIYTDFLAANARTGANTKVELFEEGDYEVALDYEIRKDSWVDSYTNYRIFFTFKIRNGNCMVYPFDTVTGSELADNAITENGFKLDMARSRYLTIDVTRTILRWGENGYVEDVRYNRPAKDGDMYVEEGIYTLTVKNLYTDSEPTIKTIYVGDSAILRALSANSLSLQEINALLADGAEINDAGSVVISSELESEEEPEMDLSAETVEIEDSTEFSEQDIEEALLETQSIPENKETFAEEIEPDKSERSMQGVVWGVVIFSVATVFVIVMAIGNKKKVIHRKNSVKADKEGNNS